MILRQAKNAQSGRAPRAGGARPPGSWRPPALGRAVWFLDAVGREAPSGAEWTTPRAHARAAGGGPGEGKPAKTLL